MPSTATHIGSSDAHFRITHPYHPLKGQEFELLTHKHTWGEHRVYYHDQDGHLRSLPAHWTDAVPQDPFTMISAGRSCFHMDGLLALVLLLQGLEKMSVKEIMP
jgi:hypothetical protein